jgi:hypothetical protein
VAFLLAKERVKLFTQLAELLRSQHHLPFATSNAMAYQAARAAFIFKEGKDRSDYEKALPHLVKFYQAICERDTSRETWIAFWPTAGGDLPGASREDDGTCQAARRSDDDP